MLKTLWKEWIVPLLIAIVIAITMRTYVAEARIIPSSSMEPTIQINDRILIEKVSCRFSDLNRGDIVVFWPPEHVVSEYPYVKRVIGLPGESVLIREGNVYIDDIIVTEDYARKWLGSYGPIIVPEGKLFVLGDNRGGSSDSRVWGLADVNRIIGKAVFVVWPPTRATRLH